MPIRNISFFKGIIVRFIRGMVFSDNPEKAIFKVLTKVNILAVLWGGVSGVHEKGI
jgi:hypothetical protein